MLGGQALTFIAVQVVEVGLGYLAGALAVNVGIHHAHRRFGKDRQRRGNDLEVVTALFLQRQEGFVFPGQQHIADAVVDEGDGRATRSGVEYRNVLVQLGNELLGLRFAAVLLLGKGPGGQQVPARAAGGFRVRRDHCYARLDQVIPVLDALRVALAHQEHDGRGIGRAGIRQALLPVLRDQLAEFVQLVDIPGQRQGHHVGAQTVDHRTGLLARAAMGLLDGYGFIALGLPVLVEGCVEFTVQLTGRVIGHVEQGLRGNRAGDQGAGQGGQGKATNRHADAPTGTHGELAFNEVTKANCAVQRRPVALHALRWSGRAILLTE